MITSKIPFSLSALSLFASVGLSMCITSDNAQAATISLGDTVFLGDSITQANSNGDHQSYRYSFWKKLIDGGHTSNFVGSHSHNYNSSSSSSTTSSSSYPDYMGQTFSNNNEGHWGWSTGYVTGTVTNPRPAGTGSGTVSTWTTGYTADTVFILLGVNDLRYNDQNLAQISLNMQNIIATYKTDNANVNIYLGSVLATTSNWVSDQSRITALNSEYQTIAQNDASVTYVDLSPGFDPAIGTHTYDGIHPNAAGEEIIASAFFAAATVPEPSSTVLIAVGGLFLMKHRKR